MKYEMFMKKQGDAKEAKKRYTYIYKYINKSLKLTRTYTHIYIIGKWSKNIKINFESKEN